MNILNYNYNDDYIKTFKSPQYIINNNSEKLKTKKNKKSKFISTTSKNIVNKNNNLTFLTKYYNKIKIKAVKLTQKNKIKTNFEKQIMNLVNSAKNIITNQYLNEGDEDKRKNIFLICKIMLRLSFMILRIYEDITYKSYDQNIFMLNSIFKKLNETTEGNYESIPALSKFLSEIEKSKDPLESSLFNEIIIQNSFDTKKAIMKIITDSNNMKENYINNVTREGFNSFNENIIKYLREEIRAQEINNNMIKTCENELHILINNKKLNAKKIMSILDYFKEDINYYNSLFKFKLNYESSKYLKEIMKKIMLRFLYVRVKLINLNNSKKYGGDINDLDDLIEPDNKFEAFFKMKDMDDYTKKIYNMIKEDFDPNIICKLEDIFLNEHTRIEDIKNNFLNEHTRIEDIKCYIVCIEALDDNIYKIRIYNNLIKKLLKNLYKPLKIQEKNLLDAINNCFIKVLDEINEKYSNRSINNPLYIIDLRFLYILTKLITQQDHLTTSNYFVQKLFKFANYINNGENKECLFFLDLKQEKNVNNYTRDYNKILYDLLINNKGQDEMVLNHYKPQYNNSIYTNYFNKNYSNSTTIDDNSKVLNMMKKLKDAYQKIKEKPFSVFKLIESESAMISKAEIDNHELMYYILQKSMRCENEFITISRLTMSKSHNNEDVFINLYENIHEYLNIIYFIQALYRRRHSLFQFKTFYHLLSDFCTQHENCKDTCNYYNNASFFINKFLNEIYNNPNIDRRAIEILKNFYYNFKVKFADPNQKKINNNINNIGHINKNFITNNPTTKIYLKSKIPKPPKHTPYQKKFYDELSNENKGVNKNDISVSDLIIEKQNTGKIYGTSTDNKHLLSEINEIKKGNENFFLMMDKLKKRNENLFSKNENLLNYSKNRKDIKKNNISVNYPKIKTQNIEKNYNTSTDNKHLLSIRDELKEIKEYWLNYSKNREDIKKNNISLNDLIIEKQNTGKIYNTSTDENLLLREINKLKAKNKYLLNSLKIKEKMLDDNDKIIKKRIDQIEKLNNSTIDESKKIDELKEIKEYWLNYSKNREDIKKNKISVNDLIIKKQNTGKIYDTSTDEKPLLREINKLEAENEYLLNSLEIKEKMVNDSNKIIEKLTDEIKEFKKYE